MALLGKVSVWQLPGNPTGAGIQFGPAAQQDFESGPKLLLSKRDLFTSSPFVQVDYPTYRSAVGYTSGQDRYGGLLLVVEYPNGDHYVTLSTQAVAPSTRVSVRLNSDYQTAIPTAREVREFKALVSPEGMESLPFYVSNDAHGEYTAEAVAFWYRLMRSLWRQGDSRFFKVLDGEWGSRRNVPDPRLTVDVTLQDEDFWQAVAEQTVDVTLQDADFWQAVAESTPRPPEVTPLSVNPFNRPEDEPLPPLEDETSTGDETSTNTFLVAAAVLGAAFLATR